MFEYDDEFDPREWIDIRAEGRGVFLVDYGLTPAVIAALSFSALLLMFGLTISPFVSAPLFALFSVPVYLWQSYRRWEHNENAFASWVARYGRRLMRESAQL